MSRPRTSEEPRRRRRLPFLRWGPPADGIEAAVRRVFARASRADRGRDWRRWTGTLLLLRPLGRVSSGNDLEILPDGDAAFEAMWEAIAGARERVLVNTYILDPDAIGLRLLEELTAAARRGCRVYLIYDSFGSAALRERHVRDLVEAGGRVQAFNPVLSLRSPFSRLVRNHRKILVVDRGPGFCGGMNMSCDYAGERLGTNRFLDAHLRLVGPCTEDLAALVLASFGEEPEEGPEGTDGASPRGDGSLVQVLESNVRRQTRAIQKALRYTIARSVRTCYLTSPYFVPPRRLVRDLQRAAKRGVDVRVLTAGLSDVPTVRLASRHLYGRLLKAGVRIFELRGRVLHAKTATVDGVYGSVGSFNLDHWSYRRNLEVTVTTLDRDVAGQLETRFRAALDLSREIRLEAWSRRSLWERMVQWLVYTLLRI